MRLSLFLRERNLKMSQADNVFAEKQDYLIEIREEVIKRDAMASELEKMRTYQKKITKNIASEEKQCLIILQVKAFLYNVYAKGN